MNVDVTEAIELLQQAGYAVNVAPHPVALATLIEASACKQGWSFHLDHLDRGQGSIGLTLTILVYGPNSYRPEQTIGVRHLFIVPAAAYDTETWAEWLFARVQDVERHEAMESFTIEGRRPFAPHHGDGRDPYFVHPFDEFEAARRPGG